MKKYKKLYLTLIFILIIAIGVFINSCYVAELGIEVPTNVSATDGNSDAELSVKVTWDPADGADYYIVYRADTNDGPYKKIKCNIYDHFVYDDTAEPDLIYYYKVQAIYENGDPSALSYSDSGSVSDLLEVLPDETADNIYSFLAGMLDGIEIPSNGDNLTFDELYDALASIGEVVEYEDAFHNKCRFRRWRENNKALFTLENIEIGGITIAGTLNLTLSQNSRCRYYRHFRHNRFWHDHQIFCKNDIYLNVNSGTEGIVVYREGIFAIIGDIKDLTFKIDFNGNIELINAAITIDEVKYQWEALLVMLRNFLIQYQDELQIPEDSLL